MSAVHHSGVSGPSRSYSLGSLYRSGYDIIATRTICSHHVWLCQECWPECRVSRKEVEALQVIGDNAFFSETDRHHAHQHAPYASGMQPDARDHDRPPSVQAGRGADPVSETMLPAIQGADQRGLADAQTRCLMCRRSRNQQDIASVIAPARLRDLVLGRVCRLPRFTYCCVLEQGTPCKSGQGLQGCHRPASLTLLDCTPSQQQLCQSPVVGLAEPAASHAESITYAHKSTRGKPELQDVSPNGGVLNTIHCDRRHLASAALLLPCNQAQVPITAGVDAECMPWSVQQQQPQTLSSPSLNLRHTQMAGYLRRYQYA